MIRSDHNWRTHSAVIVEVGPWRAEIDEALAPLIREIWKAGIETEMSCQETEPGIAWIEFASVEHLCRFLNAAVYHERESDSLYKRSQQLGSGSTPMWEYTFNLMDIFEGQQEHLNGGLACFEATVGAFFPQSDILVLLERLKAFNSAS